MHTALVNLSPNVRRSLLSSYRNNFISIPDSTIKLAHKSLGPVFSDALKINLKHMRIHQAFNAALLAALPDPDARIYRPHYSKSQAKTHANRRRRLLTAI